MKKILILLATITSLSMMSQVTTIASGNWNNAAIWSGASIPGSNADAIINHTVTITSATTIKSVTINGRLINNGNTISVRGGLFNNGYYVDNLGTIRFRTSNTHSVTGVINTTNLIVDNNSTVDMSSKFIVKNVANIDGTVNSNGFLTLFSDATTLGKLGVTTGIINGNFTSQIYIDRCNKWSFYSSPFNTTYNAINDSSVGRMIYTGFPGSEYPTFPFINAYKYTTNVGYITPTSISDNINRGVGYTYWNSDTVFASPGPGIPQKWKISTTGSINFNQNFTYTLAYAPSDAWNLVGNPYPGTIDWKDNSWTKSNISSTIYMWNTCNQNWSTYNSTNNASTNGATRYVSSHQGFWVLTSNNSAALSAPKSVLVDNSSTLLKTTNILPPNSLMISTNRDEMIISMDSLATDYYDQDYDALLPDTSNYLYSLNNIDKYIVNVVEYKTIDTIDISVKNIDTVTFTGIINFPNHDIYLIDIQNNTTTQIYEGFNQSFSVNGINETRFKVVFKPALLSGIKEQSIFKGKRKLVKTIDILGREVNQDYDGLIINVYDDGSAEKKIIQH